MTLTLQLHVLSDAEAKSSHLNSSHKVNIISWLNAIYKLKCSKSAAHYGVEIVSKFDAQLVKFFMMNLQLHIPIGKFTFGSNN